MNETEIQKTGLSHTCLESGSGLFLCQELICGIFFAAIYISGKTNHLTNRNIIGKAYYG